MPGAPIRILLVTAHRLLLWGLERLVDGERPRMQVAGVATSLDDAGERIAAIAPDVVVLDLALAGPHPGPAVANLVDRFPAKVLALAAATDPRGHDEAVMAGASGVILASEPYDTLLRAIDRAQVGELWLDRAATGRLFMKLSRAASQPPAERRKPGRIGTLTRRERMIVTEMARDAALSIRAVAARLGISDRTLRNHLTAIYDKLGVSGRLELWDYAHRNNLAKPVTRARTAATLDA